MEIKLLKYSQLANGLGVQQATINVWVKRGNLKDNGNKEIDITDPFNKLWLEKQKAQGKHLDLNRVFMKPKEAKAIIAAKPKTQKTTKQTEEPEAEEVTELRKIQIDLKKAQLDRTRKAAQLDDIKIAKQLGDLIPFDAVKGFFLYTVETFVKSYTQEAQGVANVLLSRFGADHTDIIETQKELSKKLIDIKAETIEELLQGLDGIVEEYQEVRGRGEHK